VGFNRAGEIVCRARAFETDLVVVEFDEHERDLQLGSVTQCQSEDANLACSWRVVTIPVNVAFLGGDWFKGVDSSLVAAIATAALGQKMCWAS